MAVSQVAGNGDLDSCSRRGWNCCAVLTRGLELKRGLGKWCGICFSKPYVGYVVGFGGAKDFSGIFFLFFSFNYFLFVNHRM